jgi:prefoldin subunit 5
MNMRLKSAAALILAASLVPICGFASDAAPQAKKHVAKKRAPEPSVQDQIETLQRSMQEQQNQINGLKQDLAAKDAELQKAQQAAADAQAAASRAEAAAQAQNQAVTENAAAVNTLQSTVSDLKSNQASLATTVSDETAGIKKAIESPDHIHYKGIGITPGGFTAAETVYRSRATGGGIATPFTGIPFSAADQGQLSEFYATSRQSRIAMLAEGKTDWGTLRGYYEADWLGTGTTSNNNQSNSYVLRQRVIWGQYALNSGWAFTGGQLWSLATEDRKNISNFSSDIMLPQTIDPNYEPGFVWTRQYGLRVTYTTPHVAFGVSAENPQVLGPGGSNTLNSGVAYIWGQPGANGGLYNGAASDGSTTTSSCSVSTTTSSTGSPTSVITCTPVIPPQLTTYAINPVPDFLAKIAFDPGWGHFEIFGINRVFRDRIYHYTTTTTTSSSGTTTTTNKIESAYNDTEDGGGIGGSLRVPVFAKKLDLGIKGLWGTGVGRYGDSTIADVTVKPTGQLAPLHAFSGLTTFELHATPRLDIYANWGGDYIDRVKYLTSSGKTSGYGVSESNSGCNTEGLPIGSNGGGPNFPIGPSSCSGNTRDITESTLGFWYDYYKGPRGRFRQGIQYSYSNRLVWATLSGLAPKGTDGMLWTSLRYYIP